jgi:hypothetical protein
MAVRFGEQRDRAQRCAMFLIELAGRVDETHCGLAAIDYRHTLEFEIHKCLDRSLRTIKPQGLSRDRFQ